MRAIPTPARVVLATILVVLAGVLAVALLDREGSTGSTTQGSGAPATDVRAVPPFTQLDLAGSNNVVVHVGGKRSVVVRGDDNLLDRVTTDVQSGELVVANTGGGFNSKTPMSVTVTVPTLSAVTLSGSGNIVVDGVVARSMVMTLPGSGTLSGRGNADRLDVTIGGSGTAQLTQLVASEVHASVSGSGSIFVTATQRLDGSVSGSGSILYTGGPAEVTKSVTGSGAIVGS